MAWGFRTRHPVTGEILTDFTDRLGRVLGITSSGTGAGSINVPGFSQGAPFFLTVPKAGRLDTGVFMASVTVSGTTLSWTNPYGIDCTIIYGVY